MKTAEVGNIFNGTRSPEEMKLVFTDGEALSKERYAYSGEVMVLKWSRAIKLRSSPTIKRFGLPENIAPLVQGCAAIGEKGQELAGAFYDELANSGVDALLDDRDERPGARFADAELAIAGVITIGDRAPW